MAAPGAVIPHDRVFHGTYAPAHPFLAAFHHAPCAGRFDNCQRKHPVPGIPGQPRYRNRTVCRPCLVHTLRVLGLGNPNGPIPGIPVNANRYRRYIHGGVASRAPPVVDPLNPPPNPPPAPPLDGFLTPLCPECEDDALSLAFWHGGHALFPQTRARPAGSVALQQPQSFTDKCFRWPMSTCTCLYTAGIVPLLPAANLNSFATPATGLFRRDLNEDLCLLHRHSELEKLKQKRDANAEWLRTITRDPRTGQVKWASQAKITERQNNGTRRACRCGRDWLPQFGFNGPAPALVQGGLSPALFCMG